MKPLSHILLRILILVVFSLYALSGCSVNGDIFIYDIRKHETQKIRTDSSGHLYADNESLNFFLLERNHEKIIVNVYSHAGEKRKTLSANIKNYYKFRNNDIVIVDDGKAIVFGNSEKDCISMFSFETKLDTCLFPDISEYGYEIVFIKSVNMDTILVGVNGSGLNVNNPGYLILLNTSNKSSKIISSDILFSLMSNISVSVGGNVISFLSSDTLNGLPNRINIINLNSDFTFSSIKSKAVEQINSCAVSLDGEIVAYSSNNNIYICSDSIDQPCKRQQIPIDKKIYGIYFLDNNHIVSEIGDFGRNYSMFLVLDLESKNEALHGPFTITENYFFLDESRMIFQ